MGSVSAVLSLTADLPEVDYADGHVVIAEGTRTGSVWVLVDGAVRVHRAGQQISTIDRPGATFGEISLLLDQAHGATVVAAGPTRMRLAHDGAQLFDRHPEFARLVAAELARRLDSLTGYLADVQRQYGGASGAPGLSMVTDVLHHLAQHPDTQHLNEAERPVSARDPDPEY